MKLSAKRNSFVVWKVFQRRVETLSNEFDLETHYYHYKWEEQSRLFKTLSYVFKFSRTIFDLFKYRPSYIFIQLPPTPVLYAAAIYCGLSRAKYISDCHNAMIYGASWNKWPLAKYLLKNSTVMLVHNDDVAERAKDLAMSPLVLRDPLPTIANTLLGEYVSKLGLHSGTYIMAPCAFAADEPIEELFNAIRMMPDLMFVMTWFTERLTAAQRNNVPVNIIFTGFIKSEYYNDLLIHAGAVLSLTDREGTQPSVASEAISAGVPLIISDLKTTRSLYEDAPIYVENRASSIVDGIKKANQGRDYWRSKIREYSGKYEALLNSELEKIRKCIESA